MSRDLEAKVRAELFDQELMLKDLAEMLDITQPYLTDILKGRRTGPKAQEHITKIKNILNIK